jgi:hypothetical protein
LITGKASDPDHLKPEYIDHQNPELIISSAGSVFSQIHPSGDHHEANQIHEILPPMLSSHDVAHN